MENKMSVYANGLSISYNDDINEAMLVFYQRHPAIDPSAEFTNEIETVEVARITINEELMLNIRDLINQIQEDVIKNKEKQE